MQQRALTDSASCFELPDGAGRTAKSIWPIVAPEIASEIVTLEPSAIVVAFPGSGISANICDKAETLGTRSGASATALHECCRQT